MLRKWRLFIPIPFHFFSTKTSSRLPLCSLSNPRQSPKFYRGNRRFGEKKTRLVLTHQLVKSTLLNCPSDLIALRFFLWCAKQHNFFHDRGAFHHMVNVVGRLTRKLGTIRAVIDELERVGCVVKAQTFLILLRICWRGKLYSLVCDVYVEMLAFGYDANPFVCNVFIDILFKNGQRGEALRFLKGTQVSNFLTFNFALCHLCRLNDLVGLSDILRMMLKKGYFPDAEKFSMVLKCFCKMGKFAEALQVLGLMATLGIPVSMTGWSILIDGYCRKGQISKAMDLLENMVETGCSPNVVIYTSLIKGFTESAMFSCALTLLGIMESNGCAYDLVLYNVLIDSFSKAGRYDDAFGIFFNLKNRNMVPDSYTISSMLKVICLSQRFSLYPKLFDNGLVVHSDLVACNSLLSFFCKAGLPFFAVELYEEMLDRGFMVDQYSFVGLLNGLCACGRVEEAVNVYDEILLNNSNLDAYIHTVIIGGLIKAGKFHRALRLFRKAITEGYTLDAVSYTYAIYGLLKGGRTTEACTLYTRMRVLGFAPNAYTYNIVLSCLSKERDMEMVKQTLQEMIDASVELQYTTLIRITNLLTKLNFSHSVFNLLIEMWYIGLMPDKAIYVLLSNGLPYGAKIKDMNCRLMKAKLEDVPLLDTSYSGDSSDMAVSMG